MNMRAIAAASLFAGLALAQSRTMAEGSHRMEIVLERLNGTDWHAVDPALVLAQGDRVRFKFRTNFDGFPKAGELIEMTGLEDIEASQRAISNLLYQHAHDSGRYRPTSAGPGARLLPRRTGGGPERP